MRRPEGLRASQALRESSYPALVVIVLRQHRMVVVSRREGLLSAAELVSPTATGNGTRPQVAWLRHTVTEYEAFIVAARAERDERNLDREIRSEQEAAFQETLRQDQEREQRRAAEDARREEEAATEAREREEQERARREEEDRVEEIRRQKVELVTEVADEPEAGHPEAVRVLIKLPGGQVSCYLVSCT